MKKLNLIEFYEKQYKGGDLEKIMSHRELPLKWTVKGIDWYFYNRELFGLFEAKIKNENGIVPNDFIDAYKNGFIKGLEHLNNEEEINLSSFRNKNEKDEVINQMKHLLFERDFFNSKGLLNYVFKTIPLIWTEKNIHRYGYHNAIIYSIDRLSDKTGLTVEQLQKTNKGKPELSMNQIALKYAYEGLFIDEAKKDEIAKENGFTSRTSGHKLKQLFDKYNNRNNRKADPDETKKVLQNKIMLFESIIELIPDDKKSDLETDLSILKSHLSKY